MEDARDELIEDVSMRVWAGYVMAETYDQLQAVDPDKPLDYRLVTEEGTEGCLPYASSLASALQDHFVFLSAESAPGDGEDSGVGPALSARVTSLEEMMGKVSSNMEELVSALKSGGRARVRGEERVHMAEPPERKVIPSAKRTAAPSSRFPLLDASVVSAALAAGVPEENLVEMQQMMSSGLPKSKKLREPALKPMQTPTAAQVLSESEDEGDGADPDVAGLGEMSGPPTMETAIGKLTELVSLLASERVKKAKSSKVELALENLTSGGGADSSGGGSLKRAAAARRALRLALQENPKEISGVVERLLLEDLTSQTQAHGMQSFNARAWMEHRSRIGSAYRTSAYAAWGVSGILDNLVRGKVDMPELRQGSSSCSWTKLPSTRDRGALQRSSVWKWGPRSRACRATLFPT